MATTTDHPIELYTDGACLGNPGPGGWAYIVRRPRDGAEAVESGGEAETTNNRMELIAVIRGLEALDGPTAVTLVGDSEYVLKGLTEWMPGWKRRNWRKSNRKPVLNADLWRRLDELMQRHDVSVQWVRGHTGHAENERCDELASAEAARMQDRQP
jgi:ribonuclease HI